MIGIKKFFFSALMLGIGLNVAAQPYPSDYFQPPLDIPLRLSGTFGELRTNHFHSGIDLKTQQRTGLPVMAAAPGTVVRIKVSPYGFGKALYLQHPNGYTTVYAHLKEFAPVIEEYVRSQQYARQRFDIELFPEPGTFEFESGEVIALSGNSGGSGAPHLHFEVRDTRTEEIINPLLFGFSVSDSRHPDLYDLEVYEFEDEELVATHSRDLIRVSTGEYALAGDEVIAVAHSPAFGIRTTDRLDGASNRNGVYSIELEIGGRRHYKFLMQRFAFAETRYINSHIDYGQKACCRRSINRLYLEPNNRFSAYVNTSAMSFPELIPDSTYEALIKVSDVAGNQSTLHFKLQYQPRKEDPQLDKGERLPLSIFRYDQPNFFKKDNIEISLPEGSLYRHIPFFYNREEPCPDCYSFIHVLASEEIPVHRYYTLRIKPDESYDGDPQKLVIMSMKNGEPVDYEGGDWDGSHVVARTRQFGGFAVMADDDPPQAIPLGFSEGQSFGGSELRISIKDKLSGIDSYEVKIDGEWQLFEYDAKNDLITHDLSKSGLSSGEHVIDLLVRDEVGNESRHNYHIILP